MPLRMAMPTPPTTRATNRIRQSGMWIWPNISRKVTNEPMPQITSSRQFHMRRSADVISIASMAMTANSGRHCCS